MTACLLWPLQLLLSHIDVSSLFPGLLLWHRILGDASTAPEALVATEGRGQVATCGEPGIGLVVSSSRKHTRQFGRSGRKLQDGEITRAQGVSGI